MHRSIGGSRFQKARAYAGGETRAQLHDGHTINEEGKTVALVHSTWSCKNIKNVETFRKTPVY